MVERVINERNERNRWVLRTIVVVGCVIVLAALFGNRFYHTVQAPNWTALKKAEAAVQEKINLQSVDAVERFIGDQSYAVIFGTDSDGEKVIVWMWNDGLHVMRQDAGLSRDAIKETALRENPGRQLLRISPGKLNGAYVWEVFSSARELEGVRKYYDYYRFADGTKLETYRLALERE